MLHIPGFSRLPAYDNASLYGTPTAQNANTGYFTVSYDFVLLKNTLLSKLLHRNQMNNKARFHIV